MDSCSLKFHCRRRNMQSFTVLTGSPGQAHKTRIAARLTNDLKDIKKHLRLFLAELIVDPGWGGQPPQTDGLLGPVLGREGFKKSSQVLHPCHWDRIVDAGPDAAHTSMAFQTTHSELPGFLDKFLFECF